MNEFNITEIQEFQNRSLVEIIFRQLEGMILSARFNLGSGSMKASCQLYWE